MNFELLLPLLTTAIVAIVGWFAAHRLAASRDRANKRRELRVQYLIQAYRNLEFASNRGQLTDAICKALESAIADIQLFGTVSQVTKAQEFVARFDKDRTTSLDELFSELRTDLRRELKLDTKVPKVRLVRMTIGDEQKGP